MELRAFCHSRAGDKGNNLTLSLITFRIEDYPIIRTQVSVQRVAEHFGTMLKGPLERFELPHLGALNFYLHDVLDGGSTRTLARDLHGKTLSGPFLDLLVDVPGDFRPAKGPW